MTTRFVTWALWLIPLGACATRPPDQWPSQDEMTDCTLLDLAGSGRYEGHDSRFFHDPPTDLDAVIWAHICRQMVDRGDTAETISKELSVDG